MPDIQEYHKNVLFLCAYYNYITWPEVCVHTTSLGVSRDSIVNAMAYKDTIMHF